ncbi:DUF1289 domain-containing protein [Chromatiaceae bacterium AAb-1]|nr:DUF1289 domain-containing protein [Chromatiaceae bacterium AAb-1]
MDQLELFDLPNPCLGICQANNRGYCTGCLRSREERFNWHNKPVEERARILKLLTQRRTRLNAKQHKEQQAGDISSSLSLDF